MQKRVLFFLLLVTIYIISFNHIYASDISEELTLYCENDIAVDAETGTILFAKNENEKLYPASTTKILTAILAIENLNLEDNVIVSRNAVYSTPIGSSVMGVKPGEIFTVEELLYGLLLPSGNDVALVLAEEISGNVNDFVNLMNEKASKIGCTNTHFANPHGFHDDNHYTTAVDMMKIFEYCFKNETFRKIISTKSYDIASTNKRETPIHLENTAKICDPNSISYYEYVVGGKTGYTEEARGTFIGYAKKDNKTIFIGCFNGSQNINRNQARYMDAKEILEYCFNNSKYDIIANRDNYKFKIYDENSRKYYTVGLSDDIYTTIINENYPNIKYNTNIDFNKLESIKDTIENGESVSDMSVGNITMTYNDNFKKDYTLNLLEINDYPLNSFTKENKYLLIIIILLVLLIILNIKYISNKKKFKNKYDRKKLHRKRINEDLYKL